MQATLFWISADTNKDTLNDRKCPIQLKVWFLDDTPDVCMLSHCCGLVYL